MNLIQTFESNSLFFYISIAFISMLVGSFLNVVVYRLPIILQQGWRQECLIFLEQKEQTESTDTFTLSHPRSHCPSCKHPVSAIENVPILSYLFLRGRCKGCKTAIPLRYPLVELVTAILSILIAVKFGVTLQTCSALLLTWALICLTLIDADTQLLPDNITLPLLWFALFISIFNVFIPTETAVIGALSGYLSLWSVFWLFKLATGKEGMGYGDFKLLAAIGAFLGWKMLPLVIILSAFVGTFIGIALIAIKGRDKSSPMPFGPYLSIAAFIALIWGHEIYAAYFNYSGL